MRLTARNRIVALVLFGGFCVALSGCSNPARDRMVGKWEADISMTQDILEKLLPADNPIASSFGELLIKSMRAELHWEFAADNTVSATARFMGKSVTRGGTWKFISGDEKSTKIQVQFENEKPREMSFVFSDPDTLDVAPFSGDDWQLDRTVTFKRIVASP